MRKIIFAGLVCLLVPYFLQGQINVTQYADESLFEVKPVFNSENIEEEGDFESQFEVEVNEALDMLENGDFDGALDVFLSLSSEYPEVPYFHFCRALVYGAMGKNELAEESYKEALNRDPTFFMASYHLGLLYVEMDRLDESKEIFEKMKEINEYEVMGNFGLAVWAMGKGNTFKAGNYLKAVIKIDPEFADAYYPLALISFYNRSYKRAYNYLETAIELQPQWEQAIMLHALLSFGIYENMDQFQKDLETLLAIDPTNYHYHSINGFLEMELGNYSIAVDRFHDALNIAVDTTRTGKFNFSSKMENDQNLNFALNYYYKNKFQIYEETQEMIDKGICYIVDKKYKKANDVLDSVLAVDDKSTVSLYLKALSYEKMRSYEKALMAYSDFLNVDSLEYMAFERRASCFLQMDDLQGAFVDYNS